MTIFFCTESINILIKNCEKKRELIFNMFSLLNISFLSPCSIWLIFIHLTLNRILIHSHKTSFFLNAECINHLTNSIQFFGIQKTATFK